MKSNQIVLLITLALSLFIQSWPAIAALAISAAFVFFNETKDSKANALTQKVDALAAQKVNEQELLNRINQLEAKCTNLESALNASKGYQGF